MPGDEKDGYRYVIGSKSCDTRIFSKRLNEKFGGRGGGKPEMVQGSLAGREEEIRGVRGTVDSNREEKYLRQRMDERLKSGPMSGDWMKQSCICRCEWLLRF